ncbi:hypothetical protein Q6262_28175, partial [Klebsiella pneumoniae]
AVQEVEQQGDADQEDQDQEGVIHGALQVLDQDAIDAIGHVLEAIDHLLQVIQQLTADDEAQGVAARHVVSVRLIKRLHARII